MMDADSVSKLGPRNSWVSLYDGTTCKGHIISRGRDGFEAYDVDDNSMGIFPTQKAAAAVLMSAPR